MTTADKNKQKQKQKQQPPAKKKKKKVEAAPSEARLLVVFDRSGSMSSMWTEATGAFKQFVEDQKKVPGAATLTTTMFDTHYDFAHRNAPLLEANADAVLSYPPRGMTALFDAVGKTINEALTQPTKEGTRTLLAIITDGQENSSREFSRDQIRALIENVQKGMGWEVVFLGANMDAVQVGATIGVRSSKSATFSADGAGVSAAVGALNLVASSYRNMDSATYAAVNDTMLDATQLYNAEKVKLEKSKTEDAKA